MSTPFHFNITFCIGAPRSGTTLLGSLLSEGDSCAPMLPECTFITQMIRHYHDIVHYADAQRFAAYAKKPEHLAQIYAAAIHKMTLTAASHFEQYQFQNLILKDPELTIYVDLIPTFFGTDSKVVCIVRDPRDVVASLYKVYQDKKERIDEDELIAQVFNYYWIVHQSQLAKIGSVYFVRFEKIVQKEESEFTQIEAYLGYAIGRKGFGKVFFDFDRTDATHSENYGNPIVMKPSSKTVTLLNQSFLVKIQSVFSGFNVTYNWW